MLAIRPPVSRRTAVDASDTPKAPDTPKTTDVPKSPEVPKAPDVSNAPDVPNAPDIPKSPDIPKALDVSNTPGIPNTLDTPDAPGIPNVPDIPSIPDIPDNAFSRNLLPSDVLLEVASYLRDDRHTLLILTHICNYWRRVLIECPLNWTYVSTKYPPRLFRLWLQRSKGVPVDAEICRYFPILYVRFVCPWIG